MILLAIGLPCFLVAKCNGSKAPEPPPIDYCPDERRAVQLAKGEVSKAEADVAIGKDATTTKDPVAMRTYREMVARDAAILPSQANSWRSVFAGQLATAEQELIAAKAKLELAEGRVRAFCTTSY